jgi:hypothetical protein
MRTLKKAPSQRIFAILVGPEGDNSMVFVPQGKDPNKKVATLTLEKTGGGVPLNQVQLSLVRWLELTEQTYQQLIKAGWLPEEARQILPRGGSR